MTPLTNIGYFYPQIKHVLTYQFVQANKNEKHTLTHINNSKCF